MGQKYTTFKRIFSKEAADEQAPRQSVESVLTKGAIFLVGTYHPANPNFAAVVKYDLSKLKNGNIPEFECIACLNPGVGINHGNQSTKQENPNRLTKLGVDSGVNLNNPCDRIAWKACLLRSTALCLIPTYLYNTSDASEKDEEIPLDAYICDIETLPEMKSFVAPEATKFSGLVFCLEEMIYSIAYPSWTNILPNPSFQRYDLTKENGSWEELKPFEWDGISDEKILGYAVFKHFILFNVNTTGLWAYHVESNQWYKVTCDKQTTHSFQGLGIIVEDTHSSQGLGIIIEDTHSFQGLGIIVEDKTLFALKNCENDSILLKLSVRMEQGEGVKFTASLQWEFTLPDRYCNFEARDWNKDVLVHLGDSKFCLVRNGLLGEGYDFQLLQLVIFTVEKEKVPVSVILEHRVEISEYSPFEPIFGFSLPASHSKQIKDGFEIPLDPLRTLRGS
jgi:hypothetical protein